MSSGGGGERIVIVGGGPAAQAAASAYREAGGAGAVTILAREVDPPYERPPLTKDFLRGESGREVLPLVAPGWYEENGVGLRTGVEVAELDLDGPAARTASGETFPFDRLLLATGADPLVPPIPGADGPGVQTMRRIGDSERLAELGSGDSALVVGSGFIGCEAAASLAMRGAAVTMATREEAPQVGRLGPEVAAEITGWLEALGVEILGEAELTGVRTAGDQATRASFDDGHETDVDRVLLALGVVRNDGLAAAAGFAVEDGVQVDPTMASADPRVLAAGDVAFAFNKTAGRRLRVEHWGEALNMGEVAGKTMAGVEAGWGVAPGFWSTIGERTIKYVGWGDGWDESRFERGEEGAFVCRYGRDGELVGVAAHRDDAAYERGRELIEERAPWS
ncbi:MAG TPA: FAD-dependent oxidoreductase [Solirubrobacterales bacterium]|jgi:NADPH-dependent 2,4-dienoyl-CoA reductase/sulfur reductase-like enzyme|nr:FAD-dependent oxidoreductase [Solirubrobacterales bacterium]